MRVDDETKNNDAVNSLVFDLPCQQEKSILGARRVLGRFWLATEVRQPVVAEWWKRAHARL